MLSKDYLKECLIKEVEIIQNVINRISIFSFVIKLIVLFSLVMVKFFDKADEPFVTNLDYFSIFEWLLVFLLFWGVDSFLLRKKELYKKLYNWVTTHRLDTDEFLFSMDTSRFEKEAGSFLKIMFWKPKEEKIPTNLIFYGVILLLIFIIKINS